MIKHITIHLTNACNLRCNYCHIDAKQCGEDELMVDDRVLNNMLASSVRSVSFAGGEPFMAKKKLYHIIDHLPREVESVAITTNGLLITESDFDFIKSKGIRLQFSLDGMMREHEINRGIDTYKSSIKNLKYALQKGIRVDVLTTVSYDNMGSVAEFVQRIDGLGITNITLLHFTPKGRGAYNAELEVERRDWIKFCIDIKNALVGCKTRVWIQPRYLTKKQIEWVRETRDVHICNRFRLEYAYVDICTGNVYPCGLTFGTPLRIGNLNGSSIEELINDFLVDQKIPTSCHDCDDKSLCMGGASCYSWLVNGSFVNKDPCCNKDVFFPVCPFPAMQIAGPLMHTSFPTIV